MLSLPLSSAGAAMFPRQGGLRGMTPLLCLLIHYYCCIPYKIIDYKIIAFFILFMYLFVFIYIGLQCLTVH